MTLGASGVVGTATLVLSFLAAAHGPIETTGPELGVVSVIFRKFMGSIRNTFKNFGNLQTFNSQFHQKRL